MKKLAIVLITISILVLSAPCWAQGGQDGGGPGGAGGPGNPGGRGGGRGMGGGMISCPVFAVMPPQSNLMPRLTTMLGLSPVQLTKINDVIAKGDEKLRPLTQKAATLTKALQDAVLEPQYNIKKVKDCKIKAQKAEEVIFNTRLNIWTQIRSILNKDQLNLLQMTMNMPPLGQGGGFGGGRGGRGGFGGGPGGGGPGGEAPPAQAPSAPASDNGGFLPPQ